jgi:hypothetical protein
MQQDDSPRKHTLIHRRNTEEEERQQSLTNCSVNGAGLQDYRRKIRP